MTDEDLRGSPDTFLQVDLGQSQIRLGVTLTCRGLEPFDSLLDAAGYKAVVTQNEADPIERRAPASAQVAVECLERKIDKVGGCCLWNRTETSAALQPSQAYQAIDMT
jgi:hypothetical protein